jgi:anti-sigma regulatory factor (Ser/Thr protein kinase)
MTSVQRIQTRSPGHVTVMPELSFSLPPLPESVQAARARLRGLLDSWGDEETRQAAILLLSEVVTNAVRHAPGRVHVTVTLVRDQLHARVHDQSPRLPMGREADEHGGRGIVLLRVLSRRWGVQEHPGNGKTVWFDVGRKV